MDKEGDIYRIFMNMNPMFIKPKTGTHNTNKAVLATVGGGI
jgi:hypothetical protein